MNQSVDGGEEVETWVLAGGDHVIGEKGGGFIGWNATVLLVPGALVEALPADASEVFLGGVVAAQLFVDALSQTFLDCLEDVIAVEAPAHGVSVITDVTDDLVEGGVRPAVGGKDRKGAAPSSDGLGDGV